jgi:FKBP-type peptidyl-prolyl cis-trans isomerase (trigger factor)
VAATVEVRPSVEDLLAQSTEKETPMPSASVDDPVVKKALEILQGNAAVIEKKAA